MKRLVAAGLCALAVLATPATAGTLADLHVISRTTGERLPVHAHAGRLYVAGTPGERYAVQVVNRTSRRILAVVSVDGINVVSGETASPDQTGYVLGPGQSHDIAGWRKNANEVAVFHFTSHADSYAARTDRPAHVGVIGVAVFREWTPPRPRPQPLPRPTDGAGPAASDGALARGEANEARSATAERAQDEPGSARAGPAAPAPGAQALRRDRLGTGHGEREHSAVTFTDFRRASATPSESITIWYDRHENLVARGIIPSVPRAGEPQPFPAGMRFVPDPRG